MMGFNMAGASGSGGGGGSGSGGSGGGGGGGSGGGGNKLPIASELGSGGGSGSGDGLYGLPEKARSPDKGRATGQTQDPGAAAADALNSRV